MRQGPNGVGLSRKEVMHEIDASLRRLGTDYVDLYQIHRWDPRTPIEETMEALHDVVKAGKARYIGASSMWAWQFAKAQHVAEMHGWTKFVVDAEPLQPRSTARRSARCCRCASTRASASSRGARSPAACSPATPATTTDRSETDEFGAHALRRRRDDRAIVEAVAKVAADRGVAVAQIALAWVSKHPAVTAPIVGATKPQQLEDAIASVDIELTADEISALESPYTPQAVQGFA